MTQQAVERTIGKLATDAVFRERFFANPAAATWEAGLALSAGELEALAALSPAEVTRFSEGLEARISRLCVDTTGARHPRPEPGNEDDAGAARGT